MSLVRANSVQGVNTPIQYDKTVRVRAYNTGYGSGARTVQTTTAWTALNIGGTGLSGARQSGNNNRILYPKLQTGTDLLIRISFPAYKEGATAGGGIRCQVSTNNGSSFTRVDLLTDGPAERWGAFGYGSAMAGVLNFTWVTSSSNVASTIRDFSGNLLFYWEVFRWSGDTIYWLDHSNAYPKYGTIHIYELNQG
jgi:hypothetical protein